MRRVLGWVATLVVCLAGWIAAAAYLWRTSVPSGLDVGGLDVHRFFSTRELTRAADYQRVVDGLWASHLVIEVVALAVLAGWAPRLVRTIRLGRVGTGVIVAMLAVVALWFVSWPFGIAQHWWQAHNGLAPYNYVSWLSAPFVSLLLEVPVALLIVVLVLGLAGRFGDRWWIGGAPIFVVIFAAFAFFSAYVAGIGTHRIGNATLRSDVRVLERREGVIGTPVRVQHVGDTTYEANAFSNGFGPSANVVLWNTLLERPFTTGEVRLVVGHELGHVAHHHVLKAVGWSALVVLPAGWLVTVAARRRGGIANPAALPFALLVLVVLGFLALPVVNVVSRRYEAEADWSALKGTRDAASARRLFVDFQRTSLQQPDPPTWDYLWLEDHPTLAQRLAMIQAWITRTSAAPAPSRAGS